MFVVIHSHNYRVKSVQQVNGDETDARNLAKDLAEAETGEPLCDDAVKQLEEENVVSFARGCPACGVFDWCSYTVAEVTV